MNSKSFDVSSSVGTSMHKLFVTTRNVSTVQVTVRATTLTDVGIRLRLPISLKAESASMLGVSSAKT